MLNQKITQVIEASKKNGWIMEPEAKQLLAGAGLTVPLGKCARTPDEACEAAEAIGYPVVAKVVSPRVVHKSDVGGVTVGIANEQEMRAVQHRYSRMDGFECTLVEEMVSGVELIVGAKIDHQFGPVVLLGMGGIGVEIYKDSAIRMAPLAQRDVLSMVGALKARKLLEGYRGSRPIHMGELTRTLMVFSDLLMGLEDRIESIDLNPVMCTPEKCVVADARIMLNT